MAQENITSLVRLPRNDTRQPRPVLQQEGPEPDDPITVTKPSLTFSSPSSSNPLVNLNLVNDYLSRNSLNLDCEGDRQGDREGDRARLKLKKVSKLSITCASA